MGNRKCRGKDCCLDKIFPGENRDKFECADECFLYSSDQEYVDYYSEIYKKEVDKFTVRIEMLDLEEKKKVPELLKSPYKKSSMKGKIVEEFTAYTIKWRCNKGHANFQTILDKNGTQQDSCLKCGKHYEYEIK